MKLRRLISEDFIVSWQGCKKASTRVCNIKFTILAFKKKLSLYLLLIDSCVHRVASVYHRELSSALCDKLEGWDGEVGGRAKKEGICARIANSLHCTTQHCKAIIIQ